MKIFFVALISIGIVTFAISRCSIQNSPKNITVIGNIYLPAGMQKLEEFTAISTPQNTEFAWDIHHVLVAKKVWEMLKTPFSYKLPLLNAVGSLLKETFYFPFTWKAGKTLSLTIKMLTLFKQQATGEAYKIALEKYNPQLSPIVTELVNQQYPICGIQDILEEVEEAGYTQRVASNIGEHFYPLLIKKYPEFFAYFKGGSTVQYDHKDTIKKPDLRYFELHKQKYQNDSIKYFIFIDEQEKNVIAAARSGMLGVLAHTSFVEQLRKDLKTIGVLQ